MHTEIKLRCITTQIVQRKIPTTSRDDVERSFHYNKIRDDVMYTFFYTNISGLYGNREGILDKGM